MLAKNVYDILIPKREITDNEDTLIDDIALSNEKKNLISQYIKNAITSKKLELRRFTINNSKAMGDLTPDNRGELTPEDQIYYYYQKFLEFNNPPGLYILDSMSITTPACTGQFGFHHVKKLPLRITDTYGILYYNGARLYFDFVRSYVIIFTGVMKTLKGYRFIEAGAYECKFMPSIKIKQENEISYVEGKFEVSEIVEESEGEEPESEDNEGVTN